MLNSPEYIPGSAIPRAEAHIQSDSNEETIELDRNQEKASAAIDAVHQASMHIVEQSESDEEVIELLHLLGNEFNVIAHYETGEETNSDSKKRLLKRALNAAIQSAKNEIGRG